MNQKIITLLVLLFLIVSTFGLSQDCYEVIADLSGINNSPYLAELEEASCELKDLFPENSKDDFMVYDFGFYSLHDSMEGGYERVWNEVISNIQSPYYLIFGKQSGSNGIYSKFMVDIKLPVDSFFYCTKEEDLQNLIDEVRVFTELKYSELGRNTTSYHKAEIAGIERLKMYVQNQKECCDPGLRVTGSFCGACLTSTEAKSILDYEGYSKELGFQLISYYPIANDTDIFENNGELVINGPNGNINLNDDLDTLSKQLNRYFKPVKVRLTYLGDDECPKASLLSGDKRGDQFAFVDIVAIKNEQNKIELRTKVYSGVQESSGNAKILILKAGGTYTNDAHLEAELTAFLSIGGCNPEIIISDHVPYPSYKNGDRLIVIGNDRCDIHESFNCCHTADNLTYKNYISSTFFGEVYSWINNPKDWEIVDYLRWRTAVIDVSSVDVVKIKAGNINKGVAFICYHALGHMATFQGHSTRFSPLTGFMSSGSGVFHILGTKELDEKPELYNIYNTLNAMIVDPNNKFSGKSQTYINKICELF